MVVKYIWHLTILLLVSNKNKVTGHVKPLYKTLVKNYSKKNEMSESKVVGMAVKNLFDSMPSSIRVKYLTEQKS